MCSCNEHALFRYASVVLWEQEKPFGGVAMDMDQISHVQWLFEKAAARAKQFNIQGVTQMLTLGAVSFV